jgi:hypothetical protein
MAEGGHCCRLGYDELGAVAFDTLGDLVSAVPSLLRMRADGSRLAADLVVSNGDVAWTFARLYLRPVKRHPLPAQMHVAPAW